jgi:C-terminal processing protease CtpA/Prc
MLEGEQREVGVARTSREAALAMVTTMRSFFGRSACLAFAALALVACTAERAGSIGALLSRDNETGALYVRDLFPGLASERAGLLPGDEIIMIDGRYVRDMEAVRIREMLRGDVGSKVRLTAVRGELVLRVQVARTQLRDASEEKPKPRVETLAE